MRHRTRPRNPFFANRLRLSRASFLVYTIRMNIQERNANSGMLSAEQGVSALIMILGITLVVTVLGVGMGLLSYWETMNSLSWQNTQAAYFAAQAGAYDAMDQIMFNKAYSTAGTVLPVASGTATIQVQNGTDETGASVPGITLVTSLGAVGNAQRKVQVKTAVDSQTGKITVIFWKEVSL